MSAPLLALLIGILCALVFGSLVARRSSRHEKIYGGAFAHAFHFLGAAAVAGTLPVVLACLVLGQGFRVAFPMALSFLVTSAVALLIFAAVERNARAKNVIREQGWTREDARRSY